MVRKVIKKIFAIIYKVIAIFNLQPALMVALVGSVLYFTGVYDRVESLKIILQVAFILSAIYAIVVTACNLLGIGKKKIKRSKGAQIVSEGQLADKPVTTTQKVEERPKEKVSTPVYYKVKQNPNYIMAEYEDRYELYLNKNGNLVKIRTDLKVNGE